MTEPAAAQSSPTRRRPKPAPVHTIGVVLAIVAAVLLLLACTALNWLSSGGLSTGGKDDSSLRGIHRVLSLGGLSGQVDSRFVASIYFTWGAWALLVIGVGAAVLGNLAGAAGHAGRGPGLVALVAGLVGVVATFVAIDLFSAKGTARVPAYSDYIKHVGPAFFCAVAGFLLVSFAGAAAARRPLRATDPETETAQLDNAAS